QGRTAAGEATLSSSSGIVAQQALYGLPQTDFNSITSGTNGAYTAAAGYNLVTGLGTPVANLLVPDLIAYQATSPANQTAADLPASSGGSGSGGSSTADVVNVFNVFDVVTMGSDAPSDTVGLGQGADTGSTVSAEPSQGTSFSAMTEHDLRAAEESPITVPAAPPADFVDFGASPGFVSALGASFSSRPTDTGSSTADSTHFDDVAGALVAAIHGGTSVVKNAGLDEFWADYGDRADEATIGQERDSLSEAL
ncbi:MAG TPA: hypothetical protein VND64_15790, partial [Pirellulales bacterium]|nr:hypothetical protein [Pirellulales bacterium]